MAAERKRMQREYRGSYYTYGNVAHELEPDYRPYYEEEERKERQKEAQRQEAAERRENRAHAWKVCFVVLILFVGCIAFMGMHVMVANVEVQVRQQKSDLTDLKAQNAILEAELAEQVDLEYIKQEAINRLGMSEPQSYQIVYIDVPKQSYTIQYASDTAEAETEGNSVLSFFRNLLTKE
ncbi:septum formation initiator family protein [Anaerotignum lactatifermentans]|uniref:Septum formation initiator family protein n=1 Tax=Anaerotignum lactatifermentans TaxID=160404 RepID=A0ABS2G7X3_9FIRM|nr:septum formation initiator family protein [Anaerotignum lactatifermentans]MBM6828278.1 septum formation initiator family protein [Anaerotignum lactatifermentans]MBM6876559.1 septum formation initiator family protein [Anaerotignum lactatifermentans]MBM6949861.1 septum formation initiator family protein [Anaerotignum lactatifermentans]